MCLATVLAVMPGRRTRGVAVDYRALDGADSDGELMGIRPSSAAEQLHLLGKRLDSVDTSSRNGVIKHRECLVAG